MRTHAGRYHEYAPLLAVLGVSALALLAFADPATSPLFSPCIWRAVTGWLCPGCGSARAIHALLHGDVGVALYTNPIAVAAMPLAMVDVGSRLFRGGPSFTCQARPGFLHAIAIGLVLFGVLRNVAF